MTRRVELADGKATTVHVVAYDLATIVPRVVRIAPETPVDEWCAQQGIREAVSGGFSVKPEYAPLGELWTEGRPHEHQPFQRPWADRRGAFAVDGRVSIDYRDALPDTPEGDLMQAGPLLVRDGRSAIAGVEDPEGFSATNEEFDQDLTDGREPRLAIALAGDRLLAVAADGRSEDEAGLTFWELADVLVDLGASVALSLDGGSAGVIVSGGRRVNVPRDDEGKVMHPASPSVTAIVLD
jgi:hypothetical protein